QFGAGDAPTPYPQLNESVSQEARPPASNIAQVHYPNGVREPQATVLPQTMEVTPTATRVAADAEPASAPEEPLITALRSFLQKRPTEAVETLKRYDAASQEMLLCLLPLAVRLTEGNVEQARPQEADALVEQLHSLALPLRARAPLHIEK